MYKVYRFGAMLVVGLLGVNLSLYAAQKDVQSAVGLASLLTAQEVNIGTTQELQAASLQPDWRLEVFKQRSQKEVVKDLEKHGFSRLFSKEVAGQACLKDMTVGGVYLVALNLYKNAIAPESQSKKNEDVKTPVGKIVRIVCSTDLEALKNLKEHGIVAASVKLPEKKEINSRLKQFSDLSLFLQKTELATHLSGVELHPSEVQANVDTAIQSYTEEMKKINSTAEQMAKVLMTARRDAIIKALLQDYPDALATIKGAGKIEGASNV